MTEEPDSAPAHEPIAVSLVPHTEQRVVRGDAAPDARVTLALREADGVVLRHPSNAPREAGAAAPESGRTLLRLVHLTDFQHGDLASPLRNDLLQKYRGIPYWARMLPAYRPQEFLQWHALAAVVRTINGLSADPDLAPDLVVTTGDATDSAQGNELQEYLTLLDGGRVHPGAHNRDLREAPSFGTDESFWLPESPDLDAWKSGYGLPHCPGLRERAAAAFEHRGLALPWLACFGNHDRLVQGRVDPQRPEWAPALDAALRGSRKPSGERAEAPPKDRAHSEDDAYATYLEDPTVFLPGAWQEVLADPARAVVDRAAYIRAHRESAPEETADGGSGPGAATVPRPSGHGFTAENARTGLGYYVHDVGEDLRFIVLDTNNPRGDVDGCVDEEQFRWLEQRLIEVHSAYRDRDGSLVEQAADGDAAPGGPRRRDRAVLLMSHHGTGKLTNDFGFREGAQTVRLRDDVLGLLARFDNVVLWLNGHTHVNVVASRNDGPADPPEAAFWEITTSAVAEWPVQVRHLELLALAAGGVQIRTRMVDSAVPVMPGEARAEHLDDVARLASLHRWVAAHDDGSVGGLHADGAPRDRTTVLSAPVSSALAARLAPSG